MSDLIFRQLAQRLDALPNGFPSTESGVELRLLARLFTLEEAEVAIELSSVPEPASQIASRIGKSAGTVSRLLRRMAARGLIHCEQDNAGNLGYRLEPFVIGFYEASLQRLDQELAALVEQYFRETKGSLLRLSPAFHRVIPVEEAVSFKLEVFHHERATELVEQAKSWGVRDCICRVQQKLIGKGCDRPINNCLAFAPVENAFNQRYDGRAITKEEALHILYQASQAGLVHTVSNVRQGVYYICNCCTCCCGLLRGVAEFDIPTAVARAEFQAVVDSEMCQGCEDCLERCQFQALSMPDYYAVVDPARCMGCGVCVLACNNNALHLERRPAETAPLTPADQDEWSAERLRQRAVQK